MASQGLILASSSSSTASGPGSITIRANSMAIQIGLISTSTDSATAAGPIDITVSGLLELSGIGGIQSISQGLGDAGAIAIRAGSLRMINNGFGGPASRPKPSCRARRNSRGSPTIPAMPGGS